MSKTPKEYFSEMPAAFLKENAGDLNATYLFELSGDNGGTWFVQIRNGELVVGEGLKENPDVVLSANAKDYVDIAEGRTNAGIAELLTITEGAAEKHISSIFGKLDLPGSVDGHRRVLAVLAYLDSA